MTRLLAIDPGTTESAYVIWDGKTILDKGKMGNLQMLSICYSKSMFDRMVIERIASYGMPVGETVFTTCIWTGRFIEAVATSGRGYATIYRRDVKLHLCGTSKAKDGNIRQRLIDLLGPQGTKKAPGVTYGCSKDVWAALAVAVTYGGLHE